MLNPQGRHSRESGNPLCFDVKAKLDSRFRGNDGDVRASIILDAAPEARQSVWFTGTRMRSAVLVLCLTFCSLIQASPLSLIPRPAQLQQNSGEFKVDGASAILVPARDASARGSAQYLADLLARTRGLHLNVAEAKGANHAIIFQRSPKGATSPAEGYTLDVTPQGIRIEASDDAGLFYGAVTLFQLLTPIRSRAR